MRNLSKFQLKCPSHADKELIVSEIKTVTVFSHNLSYFVEKVSRFPQFNIQ